MPDTLFLGYPRLRDWADAVDPARPVFCAGYTSPGPVGQYGLQSNRLVVTCAQADLGGCVHYCELLGARVEMMGGSPMDPAQFQKREERAEQLADLVVDWLHDLGFDVRRAVYDRPKDHTSFQGEADFLAYDTERGFYRADVEDSERSDA